MQNFSPEIFLYSLHRNTSLKDFNKHIQILKNNIKKNDLNKNLKNDIIFENIHSYFEAKKLFMQIYKDLDNKFKDNMF